METNMALPTPEEYLRRRGVLEEGFASGIFACYQFDTERLKQLRQHRQVLPPPKSEQELYAQELAWKEIEIDIAVAKKEAFKQAYSEHNFLPKGLTQNWISNTEPRLSKSKTEEVRPKYFDFGMLQPDTTIQVFYEPRIYDPEKSLNGRRQWQTVDFLWFSKELQKEAAARFEKFLQSQKPRRVTYNQETYLRYAMKPREVLQLWDHAVLVMHHWLKAWMFIYQQTEDDGNLLAAKKLFDEFTEREPIGSWHMECIEKYWADGMAEKAGYEA
ncbi:MAG: hypothetical protein Q9195_006671 [Heterodermia aff. obscurata]